MISEDAIGARGQGSCVSREVMMPDRQFDEMEIMAYYPDREWARSKQLQE